MLPFLRKSVKLVKSNNHFFHSTCIQFEKKNELTELVYEKNLVKVTEGYMTKNPVELWQERMQYDKWDFSIQGMKNMVLQNIRKREIKNQLINFSLIRSLGPDLAAAKFFIQLGGTVKFVGDETFYTYRERFRLPDVKDPAYLLEIIDASRVKLYYVGLQYLRNLNHLKWLCFRGNSMIDSWYIDRVSHIAPTLEFLDIGFCENIDHNALYCLYRMKNLKCLNVEGTCNTLEFRLTALTLEAERKDLAVLGLVNKPVPKNAFEM